MNVTTGRIVHYVTLDRVCRPAIVVGVYNPGTVKLHIFFWASDYGSDQPDKDNVPIDFGKAPFTWHWPEREE